MGVRYNGPAFRAGAVVLISVCLALTIAGTCMAQPVVQEPDFTVTTLEGEEIRLSDLRGSRVVLGFWATWCGACIDQTPAFKRLTDEKLRTVMEKVFDPERIQLAQLEY